MNVHDTTSDAVLTRIRSRAADRRRILFTGATIVTMDPRLGVIDRGDLLVEGDSITAVGAGLGAAGAAARPDTRGGDRTGTNLKPPVGGTHRDR
ncbi:amidohydrolase family protein, partial [Streptomyces goshikiensis]